MERKYRQRGYMEDYQREKRGKGEAPAQARDTTGPRAPRMPGARTVSRCARCGTVLKALMDPLGQCPQCAFELHSCKQCVHFDPGSRFECAQPIPARIAQKEARNECEHFEIRTVVERDTSPGSKRPEDARRAFENLFKK